jgi:antitoxin YefM
MIEVSYSEARARLAELLDRVTDDREVVRIRRQGKKTGAVLIDADDFASLEETAYLLSSPAMAQHIFRAVVELEAGHGRTYESVDALWSDIERGAADALGGYQAPDMAVVSRPATKPRRRRRIDPPQARV